MCVILFCVCHIILLGSKVEVENWHKQDLERRLVLASSKDVDTSARGTDDDEVQSACAGIFSVVQNTSDFICYFGRFCGFMKDQTLLQSNKSLVAYVDQYHNDTIPMKVKGEFCVLKSQIGCGDSITLQDAGFEYVVATHPILTRRVVTFYHILTCMVDVFFHGELLDWVICEARYANPEVIYFGYDFWRTFYVDNCRVQLQDRLKTVAKHNHRALNCSNFFEKYKLFVFLVSFVSCFDIYIIVLS